MIQNPYSLTLQRQCQKVLRKERNIGGKLSDIDYRQLFFFWYEANSEMKHYKDGKYDLGAYKKRNEEKEE